MRDLYLDPATGDLPLGPAQRLTVPGAEAVAQRLRKRFELWKGEYVLDQSKGVTYADLLGQKGTQPLLEATLRQAAVTCPGVVAIDAFALALDPATRAASVSLAGRATDGAPFTLDAFAVGTL